MGRDGRPFTMLGFRPTAKLRNPHAPGRRERPENTETRRLDRNMIKAPSSRSSPGLECEECS